MIVGGQDTILSRTADGPDFGFLVGNLLLQTRNLVGIIRLLTRRAEKLLQLLNPVASRFDLFLLLPVQSQESISPAPSHRRRTTSGGFGAGTVLSIDHCRTHHNTRVRTLASARRWRFAPNAQAVWQRPVRLRFSPEQEATERTES